MNLELDQAIRLLENGAAPLRRVLSAAAVREVIGTLIEATIVDSWPRVRYLAMLAEDLGEEQVVNELLEAVAEHGSGKTVAAEARNLHARILAARGRHQEAVEKLEEAIFVDTPGDSHVTAVRAENLALLAERRGAMGAAASWREQARFIDHQQDGPPDDPFREQTLAVERAHRAVDAADQSEVDELVGRVKLSTEEVVRVSGGDSVEAALAAASFAHVKFRAAHRQDDAAGMDKALGVLETLGVLTGTRLGAGDQRTMDVHSVFRLCAAELAIWQGEPWGTLALQVELRRLIEQKQLNYTARQDQRRPTPRQVVDDANEWVVRAEVARAGKSVSGLRMAVTRLRETAEAAADLFGEDHPHVITARLNAACAQLDLACQACTVGTVAEARHELQQVAAVAERHLETGHPARAVVAHQLEVCASIGRPEPGDEYFGEGSLLVKVRTRTADETEDGGGWNVTYASFDRVAHTHNEFEGAGSHGGSAAQTETGPTPEPEPHRSLTDRDLIRLVRRLRQEDFGTWGLRDIEQLTRRLNWRSLEAPDSEYRRFVTDVDDVNAAIVRVPGWLEADQEFYAVELMVKEPSLSNSLDDPAAGRIFAEAHRALTNELAKAGACGGSGGPWIRWQLPGLTVELHLHHDSGAVFVRFVATNVLRELTALGVDDWATYTGPPPSAGEPDRPRGPAVRELHRIKSELASAIKEMAADFSVLGVEAVVFLYGADLAECLVSAGINEHNLMLTAHPGARDVSAIDLTHMGFTTRIQDSTQRARRLTGPNAEMATDAASMMIDMVMALEDIAVTDVKYAVKTVAGERIHLPKLSLSELNPPS